MTKNFSGTDKASSWTADVENSYFYTKITRIKINPIG